jgi:hypothetical protein
MVKFFSGFVLTLLVATQASFGLAAKQPNVLLLVSDDQRPETIHALGNEHIPTPH